MKNDRTEHLSHALEVRITELHPDTLTAEIVGTGETVSVAKPPELRQSTHDGRTACGVTYNYASPQRRTATKGEMTDEQRILPPYLIGSRLLVLPLGNGNAEYSDLNTDIRKWSAGGEYIDTEGL